MAEAMIAVQGLQKSYGETQALSGVSFEIPRGQVVGFLGPNGAGKSTTMKIITGYIEASAGSVQVAGVDVAQDPVSARRRIGYLPESCPLYEDMMVMEYLEYRADMHRVLGSKRKSRIVGSVDRCGLGPVRGKNIGALSKGYRQRVGLAAAILHDPDLLILDEPTAGLDPNQVVEIRNLIKELGEEKTVLMSTHVMPEVQATCSRALIINAGLVVADDSPDHLTSSGASVEVVFGAFNEGGSLEHSELHDMIAVLPGVLDVTRIDDPEKGTSAWRVKADDKDPRRAIFSAAVEHDLVILRLDRSHISLEDTFRRLTLKEDAQ